MGNLALWMLLIVAGVVIYRRLADLSGESRASRESIATLRAEIGSLHEKVADLTDSTERVTLTPIELELKHFDRLPALTSDLIAPLRPGEKLTLLLKTYTDQGSPLFYEVEYIHQELIYRSLGEKDAAAYGQARLYASDEFRDVRILFSRPHATATLRGLSLDGHVKEGELSPNNSFKPTPLRGAA